MLSVEQSSASLAMLGSFKLRIVRASLNRSHGLPIAWRRLGTKMTGRIPPVGGEVDTALTGKRLDSGSDDSDPDASAGAAQR
jgi:hypothetical protein